MHAFLVITTYSCMYVWCAPKKYALAAGINYRYWHRFIALERSNFQGNFRNSLLLRGFPRGLVFYM